MLALGNEIILGGKGDDCTHHGEDDPALTD